MQPTHRHANTAIQLAAINHPQRAHVNLVLRETGTPRALYTLARVLRAAQTMDEIDAMNRSHPRIRHDPNAFGPGLGGIVLDHAKAA